MFGFGKKPEEIYPEVDNEAYARWLRAGRPSWIWFFERSGLEQEQLASLGDEQHSELCLSMGDIIDKIIRGDGTAPSQAPQAPVDEEQAVRQFAAQMVQKIMGGAQQPAAPLQAPQGGATAPLSMGGVTKRRDDKEKAREKQEAESMSLLGRPPDSVRKNSESDPSEEAEA